MSSQEELPKKRVAASEPLPEASLTKKTRVEERSNTTEPPTIMGTTESPKATIMNNEILNMVLECLTPKDIARSSQVCKNWQKGIQQYTWKQSAMNIKPEAFQALENAMGGKLGAQSLASGLTKIENIAPDPEFPDPTLKAEDLYVLVEVEIFGQKKAWCKSLGGAAKACDWEGSILLVDFEDDSKATQPLEIQIPAHLRDQITLPTSTWDTKDSGAALIMKKMRASWSLWRVDTGQTHCICHQRTYHDDLQNDDPDNFSVLFLFNADDIKPTGEVATTLCQSYDYNFLQPDLYVYLEPVLPQPGSDEEPDWLKLARYEEHYTQEMIDYLAEGDTKYRMSGPNVEMRFSVGEDECANDSVRSERDFLLFMEGIDWQ